MVVHRSPRGSAIVRDVHGVAAEWGVTEHHLANAVDLLVLLAWMRTKDAETGRNKPKPVWRPGDPEPAPVVSDGNRLMSLDEIDEWLGWTPPRELEAATSDGGTDG